MCAPSGPRTQGTGPGLPLPALSAVRPSPRLCVCRAPGRPGQPSAAPAPPLPENRTPNPPAWSQLKRDPVIRLSSVLHDLFLPRAPALAGRPRACTMKKPPAPREARTPAGGGHVRSVSCPGSETPASCDSSPLQGPAQCAAHSSCSTVLAKIVLSIPQLHFLGRPCQSRRPARTCMFILPPRVIPS